jgi:hypothetical protein
MDSHKQLSTYLTGKNQEYQLAFEDKKIAFATAEEVKAELKKIFLFLNIKTQPDELQKDMIVSFVLNDLKRFSLTELLLAYRLCASGQVKAEIEHFQNFNSIYIGKIMVKYEEWKRQKVKEIKLEANKQDSLLLNAKNEIDPAQRNKESYENLCKYVEENNEIPMGWNWLHVYKHMEDNNLIDMDVEDKKMFAVVVEEMIREEANELRLSEGSFKSRSYLQILEQKNIKTFANRCRVEYVKNYFSNKTK